jgi:hypothetical protein
MLTNPTKKLLSLLSLFTLIVLTSCQKDPGVDLDNPPPLPGEIKDSTFLIKSIAWTYNYGEDSIVEFYSYDTVNKKITLNWTDTYSDGILLGDQSSYNNTKAELSYNSKGLLVHATYTYPPSYIPFDYDYEKIDIQYDNENVVQEITVKFMKDNTVTIKIDKIMTPGGGYNLQWIIEDTNIYDDRYYRRAQFSSDGKNIFNIVDHRLVETSPFGTPVEYQFTRIDSLAYDAAGNVIKILTRTFNGRDNTTADYVSYEFNGRQDKGSQLSDQRHLIMNGLADLPFEEFDIVTYGLGILSFHDKYAYLQYSKHPAETAQVRMWDGTFRNFSTGPTYDNKNRLVKFTGFFVDNDLEPNEYRITYYK